MIEFNDPSNWLERRINGVKKAYIIPDDIDKENSIAVDIGSNIGAFPLVNSNKFKEIYCFEPSYYSYNEGIKNTKNINNVKYYQLAVSNENNNEVKLKGYKTANYSGNASIIDSDKWDGDKYEMVKTINLSKIYEIINRDYIDYLKIDCEGSEYDFLMHQDLSNIGYIGIEIHLQLEEKADELLNYIKERFNIIKSFNDGITMHKELTLINKNK